MTGVLRIAADKHWASDVWFGALQGFLTGTGVPWLLHYRHGREGDRGGRRFVPAQTVLAPMVAGDAVGLQWMGML
ncbi:MAG: hypothetical protein ACOC1F_06520 [Myxococcota bacterium]